MGEGEITGRGTRVEKEGVWERGGKQAERQRGGGDKQEERQREGGDKQEERQ